MIFFVSMQKQSDCFDLDFQNVLFRLIGQNSLLYLLHKLCHAFLIIDKPLRPLIDEHSFQKLIGGRRESFACSRAFINLKHNFTGQVEHYDTSIQTSTRRIKHVIVEK
ncbi:hypothetical protein LSPH24S_03477 [Lysinibacillus sphaericus]